MVMVLRQFLLVDAEPLGLISEGCDSFAILFGHAGGPGFRGPCATVFIVYFQSGPMARFFFVD